MKPRKKKNYLNNADLLVQLRQSHEKTGVTDELGKSFLLLVQRFQSKSNWYNYPKQVKDELISNALCDLVDVWHKFDETKSQNPFAYFTAVVSNSFRKTINKEKAYMNFKTFMFQANSETKISSYAQYMGKHDGINRYLNDSDYEEKEDEQEEN